MSKTRETF